MLGFSQIALWGSSEVFAKKQKDVSPCVEVLNVFFDVTQNKKSTGVYAQHPESKSNIYQCFSSGSAEK